MKASDLLHEFQAEGILESIANGDNSFVRIFPVEHAQTGDLVFAGTEKFAKLAAESPASVIVTDKKFSEQMQDSQATILYCSHVGMAHAKIKQKYADRDLRNKGYQIHPRAIVADTAKVDSSATIGPGAVIEEDVELAENVVVMANSVIESGAKLGKNTVIHPQVVIGYNCILGDSVIVQSGSVIGSEGFGFVQDEKRRNHRIPQTGIVVLEDRVIVGANNCIDRAAYHETRIKSGTVFDNLCHVAHNVTIGEDCILTAMFCVAGTTVLGNRVIASGQTGVLDHLEIADDVILLHQAGVHKSLPKSGPYAGTPVIPLTDYMKNHAIGKNLPTLKKELSALKKKVAELEKTE